MDKRPLFYRSQRGNCNSVNIWQIIFYVLVLMRMPFQPQHIECCCQVHKRTQTNRYERHFRNCWQMALGSAYFFRSMWTTKSESSPVYSFHCWSIEISALFGILRILCSRTPFWPAASPFVFLRFLDVFSWHSFFCKSIHWLIYFFCKFFTYCSEFRFFSMKNDAVKILRYVLIFFDEWCKANFILVASLP